MLSEPKRRSQEAKKFPLVCPRHGFNISEVTYNDVNWSIRVHKKRNGDQKVYKSYYPKAAKSIVMGAGRRQRPNSWRVATRIAHVLLGNINHPSRQCGDGLILLW